MKELINIQTKLKAPKNQYSSFGKYHYRSCEDILEALKPLLAEESCILSISDEVKQISDFIYTESTAIITNEKGKEVSVTAQAGINPTKKGFDIAQSFGSASSYSRKYALNGLFLIDDNKDADSQDNSSDNESKEIVKGNLTQPIAIAEVGNGKTLEAIKALYVVNEAQEKKLIKMIEKKKDGSK